MKVTGGAVIAAKKFSMSLHDFEDSLLCVSCKYKN